MTIERMIRIIAGLFVLLSLALGVEASPIYHSAYWLWFTVFVGFNLFQSGLTCFCPMEMLLKKLGMKTASEPAKAGFTVSRTAAFSEPRQSNLPFASRMQIHGDQHEQR